MQFSAVIRRSGEAESSLFLSTGGLFARAAFPKGGAEDVGVQGWTH